MTRGKFSTNIWNKRNTKQAVESSFVEMFTFDVSHASLLFTKLRGTIFSRSGGEINKRRLNRYFTSILRMASYRDEASMTLWTAIFRPELEREARGSSLSSEDLLEWVIKKLGRMYLWQLSETRDSVFETVPWYAITRATSAAKMNEPSSPCPRARDE